MRSLRWEAKKRIKERERGSRRRERLSTFRYGWHRFNRQITEARSTNPYPSILNQSVLRARNIPQHSVPRSFLRRHRRFRNISPPIGRDNQGFDGPRHSTRKSYRSELTWKTGQRRPSERESGVVSTYQSRKMRLSTPQRQDARQRRRFPGFPVSPGSRWSGTVRVPWRHLVTLSCFRDAEAADSERLVP